MGHSKNYDQVVDKQRKPLNYIYNALQSDLEKTPPPMEGSAAALVKTMINDGIAPNSHPTIPTKVQIENLFAAFFGNKEYKWEQIHKPKRNHKSSPSDKIPNLAKRNYIDFYAFQYISLQLLTDKKIVWTQAFAIAQWCQQQIHSQAYNRMNLEFNKLGLQAKRRFAELTRNNFEGALSWLQSLVDGTYDPYTYFPQASDEQYTMLQILITNLTFKDTFDQLWQDDPNLSLHYILEQTANAQIDRDMTPKESNPITLDPYTAPTLAESQLNENILAQFYNIELNKKKQEFEKQKAQMSTEAVQPTEPKWPTAKTENKAPTAQYVQQTTRRIVENKLQNSIFNARKAEEELFCSRGHGFKAKIAAAAPFALALGGAGYFAGLFIYGLLVFTVAGVEVPIVLIPAVVIAGLMALSAAVSLTYAFLGRAAQKRAQKAESLLKTFKIGNLVLQHPSVSPNRFSYEWNNNLEQRFGYLLSTISLMQPKELQKLITLLKQHQFITPPRAAKGRFGLPVKPTKIKSANQARSAMEFLQFKCRQEYGEKLLKLPLSHQYRLLLEVITHLQTTYMAKEDQNESSQLFNNEIVEDPNSTNQGISEYGELIRHLKQCLIQAEQVEQQKGLRTYYRNTSLYWGTGCFVAGLSAVASLFAFSSLFLMIVFVATLGVATVAGVSMTGRAIKKWNDAHSNVNKLQNNLYDQDDPKIENAFEHQDATLQRLGTSDKTTKTAYGYTYGQPVGETTVDYDYSAPSVRVPYGQIPRNNQSQNNTSADETTPRPAQ